MRTYSIFRDLDLGNSIHCHKPMSNLCYLLVFCRNEFSPMNREAEDKNNKWKVRH